MAESCKMTMKLLIISKFSYGPPQNPGQDPLPRWCYLGRETNEGRIYRPIPLQSLGTHNERDFFWQNNFDFNVGETHEFEIISFPANQSSLPHCNDDIQVTYKRRVIEDGVVNMAVMFQGLSPYAKGTIEEALGLQAGCPLQTSRSTGGQFVEENTNCHSFGIIRCMRQVVLQPPLTVPPQEVLVIKELGRPLSGYMSFNPRRCFLLEVGEVPSP